MDWGIIIALAALFAFVDFGVFLVSGKRIINVIIISICELASLVVLPIMYANFGRDIDCCDPFLSAAFSPNHYLTIVSICIVTLASYYYSKFRKSTAPPIIEVFVNAALILGILLNIIIAIHTNDMLLVVLGSFPIIFYGIMMLAKNQQLIITELKKNQQVSGNRIEKFAWQILLSKPMIKYPMLFVFSIPVVVLLIIFLLLFGQRPDSIIRAFTETYKQGFSQWDYKCDNINCGGHFLCSIAAKGHLTLVKPQRMGVRNGGKIICNRQLLVSNAFEDLVMERIPILHKFIRSRYNKVGNVIHKYYWVFNKKIVSDIIYVFMKPFELLFLLSLYMADKNPENRIAKQYLSASDRNSIDEFLNTHQSTPSKSRL